MSKVKFNESINSNISEVNESAKENQENILKENVDIPTDVIPEIYEEPLKIYVDKRIEIIKKLPPENNELRCRYLTYEDTDPTGDTYFSICTLNSSSNYVMFSPLFTQNEETFYHWSHSDENGYKQRHFGEVWISLSGSYEEDFVRANNEITILQQEYPLDEADELDETYTDYTFSDKWQKKAPNGYTWHYVFMGFKTNPDNVNSGYYTTNVKLYDNSEIAVRSAINWKTPGRWNPTQHKALMQLVKKDIHKETEPHFSSVWQYECCTGTRYMQKPVSNEPEDDGYNSEDD